MSEVSLKIASWLASGLYVLLQIKSIVTSYIFSITYMCRANAIDSRDQIVSHKVSLVSISSIAYHICLGLVLVIRTHILRAYFTGTWAAKRLLQCQCL